MPEDLDETYHEYLWGEASPRSFAQKAKIGGSKSDKRESRSTFRSGKIPR